MFRIFVFILLICSFTKPVLSLSLGAFTYKIEKEEGVVIQWAPVKKATKYLIYANGKLIKETKVASSIGEVEDVLGGDFKRYLKRIKDANDKPVTAKEFLRRLQQRHQDLVFLSVYEKRIARLMGVLYKDTSQAVKKGQLKYKVVAYSGNRILESGVSKSLKWPGFPKLITVTKVKAKASNTVAKVYLASFEVGFYGGLQYIC